MWNMYNLEIYVSIVISIKLDKYLLHKFGCLADRKHSTVHLHHLHFAKLPIGVVLHETARNNCIYSNVIMDFINYFSK